MSLFRIILIVFFISACAQTQVAQEVDEELQHQPQASLHGEVARKGMESIMKSTSLTQNQKEEFLKIHTQVMHDTVKNREETARLKTLLFDTLAATPYQPEKVDEIKNRLLVLNKRKMDSMTQALSSIQKLVGYMTPQERYHLIRDFMEIHQNVPMWEN